jgi:hypothetical protein
MSSPRCSRTRPHFGSPFQSAQDCSWEAVEETVKLCLIGSRPRWPQLFTPPIRISGAIQKIGGPWSKFESHLNNDGSTEAERRVRPRA